MSARTLSPGESVDFPNGYVARSWREGLQYSYYAERTGDMLSPGFATFAEAHAWLEAECAGKCVLQVTPVCPVCLRPNAAYRRHWA